MQNKTEMDKGETSGEVDEIYASDVTEKESASGYSILLAFRNVAVCVSVCVLMFVKIDIPDCNIVAMIFFAVVGITSLIELGFPVNKAIEKCLHAKKGIE